MVVKGAGEESEPERLLAGALDVNQQTLVAQF
jgi:hypothetical protein